LGGSSVCFGSIESLCFGKEAKQPKETVSKQTEKNEKNEKKLKNRKNPEKPKIFCTKITKYAPYQTVSIGLLSFRFNRNIKSLCFGIEAKQPKQTFCFG
jgi:hypothetical protein